MKNINIIYSLTVADIQTVANQEIHRNLTSAEVNDIRELIGEKIQWYEAISDSINEKFA